MNSVHLFADMKRLPPFAALRAFDAAARRLSFKDAAAELGLTPTAVSHQIRRLETDAETQLFHRLTRSIVLTSAGERFAHEVSPALDKIRSAYFELNRSNQTEAVVISAGPLFSSRWLAPRLSEFAVTHPEIELRLHPSQRVVSQKPSEVDITIAWGMGGWPGVQSRKLLGLNVTPVLSPELAEMLGAPVTLEALAESPLLHHRDTAAWQNWFAARGMAVDKPNGSVLEDANVLWQAAIFGQGAMLGYVEFIHDDIRSGRLLQPLDDVSPVSDAYFLVTPEQPVSKSAAKVAEWLLQQASSQDDS